MPTGAIFGHMGATMFPNNEDDVFALLALSTSRVFATFLELSVGLGDSVTSGSAARRYSTGVVGTIPLPRLSKEERAQLSNLAERIVGTIRVLRQFDETSPFFTAPPVHVKVGEELSVAAQRQICMDEDHQLAALQFSWDADRLLSVAYGLDASATEFVDRLIGRHPCDFQRKIVSPEVIKDFWS